MASQLLNKILTPLNAIHCNENSIYVFPEWNCAASVLIPIFMCLRAIYIFPGWVCLFGCSKIGRPSWENRNCSQIYKWGNMEREHYNSVWKYFGLAVSVMKIHKSVNRNQTFIFYSHALLLLCRQRNFIKGSRFKNRSFLDCFPELVVRNHFYAETGTWLGAEKVLSTG